LKEKNSILAAGDSTPKATLQRRLGVRKDSEITVKLPNIALSPKTLVS